MHRTLLAAATALSAAAAVAAPPATDAATLPEHLSIAALQTAYLACDSHSREHRMDATTAQHCVRVADTLRRRAFGNDFERMLAWWRAQRHAELADSR